MSVVPLVELLLFAAFMVGTPGPANMVIMAAGARHGMRRCVRFLAGLLVGKALVNTLVGAGFGALLDRHPVAVAILKFSSAAVMIWLALLTLRKGGATAEGPALSLPKGVVVHLVNPKAYVMSTLAWSSFAPAIEGQAARFAAVVLSFAAMQLVFHTGWGFAGQVLRHTLGERRGVQETLVALTIAVVLAALLV